MQTFPGKNPLTISKIFIHLPSKEDSHGCRNPYRIFRSVCTWFTLPYRWIYPNKRMCQQQQRYKLLFKFLKSSALKLKGSFQISITGSYIIYSGNTGGFIQLSSSISNKKGSSRRFGFSVTCTLLKMVSGQLLPNRMQFIQTYFKFWFILCRQCVLGKKDNLLGLFAKHHKFNNVVMMCSRQER